MSDAIIQKAMNFMRNQNWSDALKLFEKLEKDQLGRAHVLYMIGQCRRFLGDVAGAIKDLNKATLLDGSDPPKFLALGIAYQLNSQFEEAIKVFGHAIELDNDYELAFNSLALTQKKCGEFQKASENYDQGLKALTRKIVRKMENRSDNLIFKHESIRGHLWMQYASYGALYLAATDNIMRLVMPSGAFAREEEETERHRGLYWIDNHNENNEKFRLFLPNYFNTFHAALRRDSSYVTLIGNRGTVLELLNSDEEAEQHFTEVKEFSKSQ